MIISEGRSIVDTKSEFEEILDRLRTEVLITRDLSSEISEKTAKLQEFRHPTKESGVECINSDGVIGALRSIIEDMLSNNSILGEARQALGRYVG